MLHDSISKATFYIAVKSSGRYKVEGPFKVLINPSKISVSSYQSSDNVYSARKRNIICTASGDSVVNDANSFYSGINTCSGSLVDRKISMDMVFDLVEGYEFAKLGGVRNFLDESFADDFIFNDPSKISIFNERFCCVSNLSNAFENSYPVQFIWGSNIEFVGKISNMSIKLTYFSDKGAPLRANVGLVIKEENYQDIFH